MQKKPHNKKLSRRLYRYLRRLGVCPVCRHSEARPGYATCVECGEQQANAARMRRAEKRGQQ